MLISQLGEQYYSQSGKLVQSDILMTQIGNLSPTQFQYQILTQFKVHLWV